MAQEYSQGFRDKAVEAALALSEEKGWNGFGFLELSQKLDCSLADLYEYFDDKGDLLYAVGRMVDRRVMAGFDGSDVDGETPREKLFEIMMERFDVLNENRAGVLSILQSIKCDPKLAVFSLPHLTKSMSWMLELAGLNAQGLKGSAAVLGLCGVYLHAARAWMEDDTEDMAKTMAALDLGLSKAEVLADRFG